MTSLLSVDYRSTILYMLLAEFIFMIIKYHTRRVPQICSPKYTLNYYIWRGVYILLSQLLRVLRWRIISRAVVRLNTDSLLGFSDLIPFYRSHTLYRWPTLSWAEEIIFIFPLQLYVTYVRTEEIFLVETK